MNALSMPHPLHWTRRTFTALAVIVAALAVAITLSVSLAGAAGNGTNTVPVHQPHNAKQVQCRPSLNIGAYC